MGLEKPSSSIPTRNAMDPPDTGFNRGAASGVLLGGAQGAVKPVVQKQRLYRAVGPEELADLKRSGLFRNPKGIENKYFSTTRTGAQQYGDMAQKAFKDGPYSVVETSIARRQITQDMQVTVDRGIQTVTVPSGKLNQLTNPIFR